MATIIEPISIPTLRHISDDFVMFAGAGRAVAYHIASGDLIGKEGFIQYCSKHYGRIVIVEDGNPRNMESGVAWWNWSDDSKRAVRRVVMEPTTEPEDGPNQDHTVFNRWHVLKREMAIPDMSITGDSIQPLIDHLMYISDGDHAGVMYFLNWLAQLWRFPGTKIPTAIMLYSKHSRVGKSTLAKLLRAVFGPSLVKSIDGLKMHGNFMDAFEHKRIAVLNELARTDKQDSYERFKSLVSEEEMEFEGKGRASKEVQNHLHFIVTTNNPDALPLMEGDGRVLVLRCESERRSNEYYRELYAWIDGPGPALLAGAFAQWQFPVDWDYKAPVPQTDAVRKTQKESRSPLSSFIEELIDQQRPPFDRDMGRITGLVEQLGTLYPVNIKGLRLNNRTLPAALTGLGGKQIPTVYTATNGKRISCGVWCWRNQLKWENTTGEERSEHFN